MRKLLSKPGSHEPTPDTTVTRRQRPSGRQDAVYQAHVPIAALDRSPDGRSAVLGGRHVLKTVRVEGREVREVFDLRALITAQAGTRGGGSGGIGGDGGGGSSSSTIADQLSIGDVKWAPRGSSETCIFTACLTGKIFQYDLGRVGSAAATVAVVQTQEDSRQVSTLDINPHRGSYLLSGGQDGIVRCFDIRAPVAARLGPTFRSVQQFRCNAGVRHVQWSPREGFYFACGTEQGVVLKWDIRKATAPVLRINAHDKACVAVAWHPDGEHLASAGSDKRCHVWDLSRTADKRQKPQHSLATPSGVAALAWRPPQWSAACQGLRAAQLAVSYSDPAAAVKRAGLYAVHIWDLARPAIPYKTIDHFASSPAALLWRSPDLLWTAGDDGLFCQVDAAFAPRTVDRLPVSSLAFSPRGHVLALLDERPPPVVRFFKEATTAASIPNSDSEDEGVRSFLVPRRRTTRRRQPPPPTTTPSSTPPDAVLSLDAALPKALRYRPQQIMAMGPVPSAARPDVYAYLAGRYLEALENGLPQAGHGDTALPARVAAILDTFARAAERVSQYRLAQVWRILAFAVDLLLRRRAQYHLEKRTAPASTTTPPHNQEPAVASRTLPVRSLLTEEIESTSNVPTPLARPAARAYLGEHFSLATGSGDGDGGDSGSSVPSDVDGFALPPALYRGRRHLDSLPLSETSHASSSRTLSSIEGYDFYDTEAMARAIDMPARPGAAAAATAAVPSFHASPPRTTQDSDGSAAHIFRISQVSGARESDDLPLAQSSVAETDDANYSEYQTRIRGRQMARSGSLGSERLARLSRALGGSTATSVKSINATNATKLTNVNATDATDATIPPPTDITETDYLPWPDDDPFPFPLRDEPDDLSPLPPAIHPYVVVQRALAFETRTSPLHAAAMVLLLKPLLPDPVIDPLLAAAVLRQHHARLMGMQLFLEAALLRKLLVRGWPAADLAAWGASYPSTTAPAQHGVSAAYLCPYCRKPRERTALGAPGRADLWTCERCRRAMAPCAVCGHRDAAPGTPRSVPGDALSTWWYCAGCGHGGHATCMEGWHAAVTPGRPPSPPCRGSEAVPPEPPVLVSDGCCPLDGCGHACLPGRWRAQMTTARSEALSSVLREARETRDTQTRDPQETRPAVGSRKSSLLLPDRDDGVRADAHDVAPSRAVDKVRESLSRPMSRSASASGSAGAGASTNTNANTSPAPRSEQRERRKSVKFAGDR